MACCFITCLLYVCYWKYCFYDTALSYIRIPKSVSDIYPFANINIYIDVEPGNENYISEDGSLYNTKYDRRGKMLVKYFCSSPNVSIKDVRHIGSNAFSGCKNLVQITIPKSVYIIDEYVFTNCENLETINIYHTHDKFLENIKYGNRAKINYLD